MSIMLKAIPSSCVVLLLSSGCPDFDAMGPGGATIGAAGSSSSSSSSVNSSSCIPLDGLYRVTYVEVTGNCGPQSEEAVQYSNGELVPNGTTSCQAGGSAMVSLCEMRRDSLCALSEGTTGTLIANARVTGTLTETDSNRRLEGNLDVTLVDTTGATCESTYHATAVKTR